MLSRMMGGGSGGRGSNSCSVENSRLQFCVGRSEIVASVVYVNPNLNFTDIGSFFDNTDISSVCRVSSLVLKEFMR